jgi:hypothetical protein
MIKSKCKLCLKEAKLSYSHIIPELLYINIYDELHRAIKVTPDKIERPPYIQKGMREYLLCYKCETQLSRYEDYASRLLNSILVMDLKQGEQSLLVTNIEYEPFKLFQMSLLWRSSVSTLEGFESVSLGTYEEDLRLRILNEDPGEPLEYGCLLMMYPGGSKVDTVLFTPVLEELAGKTFYRLHTGRWFWYFIHPGQFEEEGEIDLILSKSGMLRISIAQWSEDEFMSNLRNLFSKTRNQKNKNQGA